MTRTIVITSGKGGVGKTNFALNTALELTKRHYRTCLLDGDLGLANVNILLDIQPELTLDDCIYHGQPLLDVIFETASGLHIIPGSSGFEETADLPPEKINRLIEEMSSLEGYDFFLIDTSSGISRSVISFCLAAPETILVLTPEATSLTDAYSLVKVLAGNSYKGTVKVLVNKCSNVPQAQKTFIRFKQVANKHLDIHIAAAGLILYDPEIEKAIARQEPVLSAFPNSTASQCIRAVVSNLIKSNADLETLPQFGTFWSRYFKLLQADLALPGKPSKPSYKVNEKADHPESTPIAQANQQKVEEKTPVRQQHPLDSSQLFTMGIGTALPSPLPFLCEILRLSSSQKLSKGKIHRLLSLDPVLLSKFLQLYISTYPVETVERIDIHHMLIRLGEEMVSTLLVATALEAAMQDPPEEMDNIFVFDFWFFSYRCALLAQELALFLKHPIKEEAFFAGLLHEIGRLVIQRLQPSVYSSETGYDTHGRLILETEMQIFGKTHAELGEDILRGLRLNTLLVDAARLHTLPDSIMVTALDFNKIVYLAQQACLPSDPGRENVIEKLILSCGLTIDDFNSLSSRVDDGINRIVNEFQLGAATEGSGATAAKQHESLRQLAMSHILTQNIMPPAKAKQTLAELIRAVTQGFSLLFGISKVIWLFPDPEQNHLLARGYPGCTGYDWLKNISFRMDSSESLVVQSFQQQKIFSVTGDPPDSLMDKQLLSAMETTLLLCLPLLTRTSTLGLIVCEVPENKRQNIQSIRDGLQQFGTQIAAKIAGLHESTTT